MRIYAFHDGHACGYYRLLLPLDQMTEAGHDIKTAYGWQEEAREYPIIVGQRIGKYATIPMWRRLRAGHKLVYEIDDDVWSIDPSNMAAYLTHDESTVDAINECIRASNLVTVSTEPLAKVLRQFSDNVVVLPNFIDEQLLSLERPRRDKVVVGWAGGDSHLKDLSMVVSQLRRFLERNPIAEFHNVGTDYTRVLGIPGRYTEWAANLWEYYRHVDFDIGIAPLADTVFNDSKSHIKCLEYAALGIPVVASDKPPYRDFVLDGVTGFLVRKEHEWGRRLWQLTNDVAMREEMGEKARQHAATYTIQRNWRAWEDVYGRL